MSSSTAKTARPTLTVQVAPQTLVVGARIVLSVTKVRVAVRTPVRAVTGAGCPTCAPPTLLPVCAHTLTVTIAPRRPAVVGVVRMVSATAATLLARRTVDAVSGTRRNAPLLLGIVSYTRRVGRAPMSTTVYGVQPTGHARTQAQPSTAAATSSTSTTVRLVLLLNVVTKPTVTTVCCQPTRGSARGAHQVVSASTTTPPPPDAL